LGFGILDFRFGIWDFRFGILDLGFGIWDLGFGILDLGFGIKANIVITYAEHLNVTIKLTQNI
jgi:hypothetical protein